jgi:hypothetical protein
MYALDTFAAGVTPERSGSPSIALSLRADRVWGADESDQAARIKGLWQLIAAEFPDARGVAIGIGTPGTLPAGIEDATTAQPDAGTERRWLSLMHGADLAIGVHGSNMLLPSGFASSTLELLPASRYGNAFQATLMASQDPVAALVRHRTIYGSEDLSDVSAERVAEVAVSILKYADRTERLMSGPAAGQASGDIPPLGEQSTQVPAPRPAGRTPLRQMSPVRAVRRLTDRDREEGAMRARLREARRAQPPLVVSDERGLAFELESEEEIRRFALEGGHVERNELRVVARYVQPPMTALDVGANFGVFTVTLASTVGEAGSVHSFEPLPAARSRLERAVALNQLRNVRVNEMALSDAPGAVRLFDYGPGYE